MSTQAFERYSRYEPHIAEGLTQMFVAGVSTHKVGEVAQTLLGVAPGASTISRLNQTLSQQFEAWREYGLSLGFQMVFSGPLVRSSYMADIVSEQASH